MKQQHPLDQRSRAGEGNVRSSSMRKLAKDGKTWTPTEQRKRDKALKQFCKFGRKGVGLSSGASEEYKDGWERIFGGKK